jgi:hypothetical protein
MGGDDSVVGMCMSLAVGDWYIVGNEIEVA